MQYLEQLFFFALQYTFGLMLGLFFYRKLPFALIVLISFIWGMLGWVVLSHILCISPLPFTFRLMAIIEILLISGFAVFFFLKHCYSFSRSDLYSLLVTSTSFMIIAMVSLLFNVSNLTNDSYYMIYYGKLIAYSKSCFDSAVLLTPFSYGMFVPTVHAVTPFFDIDYFYAYQPVFSIAFVSVLFYLIYYAHKGLQGAVQTWWLPIIGVLLFITTPVAFYHLFYIHTNLTAATYLSLTIILFWIGLRERESAWFSFSSLALFAFSLVRTETPMYSLILATLMARYMDRHQRLLFLVPPIFLIGVWQTMGVILFPSRDGAIVNQDQALLVIVGVLAFIFYMFLSNQFIEKYLTSKLHLYLLGVMFLSLIGMLIVRTSFMSSSILNFILNLFQTGGWGVTWVVVLLLFLACLSLPRYVNEEFIVYNLITFMVFVVIVGFFRGDKFGPYRAAFTDSANRMMLHILPLFIFHLVMKYGYFLGNKQGSMRDVSADLEDELSRRNFIVQ